MFSITQKANGIWPTHGGGQAKRCGSAKTTADGKQVSVSGTAENFPIIITFYFNERCD
jgi:hypothetical protein